MKDLDEKIEKLFDNVTSIKEYMATATALNKEIYRRTENLEIAVEKINLREQNCPGKLYAIRKTGVIETVKDLGLLLGIALVLMQLFGVIK